MNDSDLSFKAAYNIDLSPSLSSNHMRNSKAWWIKILRINLMKFAMGLKHTHMHHSCKATFEWIAHGFVTSSLVPTCNPLSFPQKSPAEWCGELQLKGELGEMGVPRLWTEVLLTKARDFLGSYSQSTVGEHYDKLPVSECKELQKLLLCWRSTWTRHCMLLVLWLSLTHTRRAIKRNIPFGKGLWLK